MGIVNAKRVLSMCCTGYVTTAPPSSDMEAASSQPLSQATQQQLNDALGKASSMGDDDRVKSLIESKANVNAVCEGKTALCLAAKHGHAEIVKKLLKEGADTKTLCTYRERKKTDDGRREFKTRELTVDEIVLGELNRMKWKGPGKNRRIHELRKTYMLLFNKLNPGEDGPFYTRDGWEFWHRIPKDKPTKW